MGEQENLQWDRAVLKTEATLLLQGSKLCIILKAVEEAWPSNHGNLIAYKILSQSKSGFSFSASHITCLLPEKVYLQKSLSRRKLYHCLLSYDKIYLGMKDLTEYQMV